MRSIVSLLVQLLPERLAYAHCDIPCGIYDPHNAQMAAHTIIRMTELLGLIKRDDELKAEHDIARITHVKEEHANLLEHELVTLRYDYFKEEHIKKFPELVQLFEEALKTSAKARVGIDMNSAKATIEKVMQIAEIFYKTKGVTPVRVKSVYPTAGEFVVYK